MRFLLDTHVVIWLAGEPHRVRPDVLSELADRGNELLVSAVSAMEAATKLRLGRLELARSLVDTWDARLVDLGAGELPITSAHALLAGGLDWDHRDPFDRLLVAQALVENLTLVTTDRTISAFPGFKLLTW